MLTIKLHRNKSRTHQRLPFVLFRDGSKSALWLVEPLTLLETISRSCSQTLVVCWSAYSQDTSIRPCFVENNWKAEKMLLSRLNGISHCYALKTMSESCLNWSRLGCTQWENYCPITIESSKANHRLMGGRIYLCRSFCAQICGCQYYNTAVIESGKWFIAMI